MTAPPTHGPPEPDEGPAASFPEPPGDPVEYQPSGWEPTVTRPDPMTEEEREAWLDDLAEPFDPEEYPEPDGPPPPGEDELTAAEVAAIGAAFGSGLALDVMPGCPDLALLADAAAGPDDTYDGACDDELIGVLCAWDRLEAHMAARKLAAAAELMR